jgi:hypothetical protein
MAMKDHVCRRPSTCICSIQAIEPKEDCPIHGSAEWPPRCETCGRFLPWPKEPEYVGPSEYIMNLYQQVDDIRREYEHGEAR